VFDRTDLTPRERRLAAFEVPAQGHRASRPCAVRRAGSGEPPMGSEYLFPASLSPCFRHYSIPISGILESPFPTGEPLYKPRSMGTRPLLAALTRAA
jgi:hypothetical protein